jgi:hypothetical protein
MMDKIKLDWLDAAIVKPPPIPGLTYSELVMLKYSDGYEATGYAVYINGKFSRWSICAKIVAWAYYK